MAHSRSLPLIPALLAAVLTLSGCATGPSAPQERTLAPASYADLGTDNADAVFRSLLDARPDALGLGFLNRVGDGFVIYRTGEVEYRAFRARSDLRTYSQVETVSGNRLCVAPADGWSGACFDIARRADGGLRIDGAFGNNQSFGHDVDAVLILAPSKT